MYYTERLKPILDKREQTWLAGLAVLLVGAAFFRSLRPISDWKLTHWLFNYQDEFLKRGLVGEVFRRLGIEVTRAHAEFVSYVFIALVLGMMIHFFYRPVARGREKTGLWLFFLMAVTSSATFQHFNYDLGRFDIFCFALALTSLLVIRKGAQPSDAVVVVLLMSIAILVHEASFFIYVPMVLAYWFYLNPLKRNIAAELAVFLLLMLVTYLVSTEGLAQSKPLTQQLAALQQTHGDWVAEKSLQVLYNGGLSENVVVTLDRGISLTRVVNHIVFAISQLPLLLLVVRFIRSKRRIGRHNAAFIILAAVGPLALYPLGSDHFRWWALALTNFFIATALVAWHDPRFREEINALMLDNRPLVFAQIMLSLAFGPVAVTESFPFMYGVEFG